MTDQTHLTAAEARDLLARADRIGRDTHRSTTAPYSGFLLALGSTTALGTLAMTLTDGRDYFVVMGAVLVVSFTLVGAFMVSIRGNTGWSTSRRWQAYMTLWTLTYVAGIVAATAFHGVLAVACCTSAAILAATVWSALHEARR
jgi:hypothetical protein